MEDPPPEYSPIMGSVLYEEFLCLIPVGDIESLYRVEPPPSCWMPPAVKERERERERELEETP